MKKIKIIALIVFCLVGFACTRVAPFVNYYDVSAPMGTTEEVMRDSIIKAGEELNWKMKQVSPNKIEATLHVNAKHTAVVNITYDSQKYSIVYSRSENLKDKGKGTIHKNYNVWVGELQAKIDSVLAQKVPLK